MNYSKNRISVPPTGAKPMNPSDAQGHGSCGGSEGASLKRELPNSLSKVLKIVAHDTSSLTDKAFNREENKNKGGIQSSD